MLFVLKHLPIPTSGYFFFIIMVKDENVFGIMVLNYHQANRLRVLNEFNSSFAICFFLDVFSMGFNSKFAYKNQF
jgi:hypothetical protein